MKREPEQRRPEVLRDAIPREMVVAGVDLGGTNIQVGILSADGRVLGRCKRKTKASEGRDEVVRRVLESIQRALDEARIPRDRLFAVGVGAPAVVDFGKGLVVKAGNLGWEDVPLRAILSEQLRVPVALDNDANCAAWGEAQLGAARGRENVLAVWVGTGIGGGLVLGGQVWRGPRLTAGEIGYVTLFPNGQPGMMTVEDICSRTGMVGALRRLLPAHPESVLHRLIAEKADESGAISSSMIARAYEKDDELVRKVVDRSAELLGGAIANLVTVLSIDCVVLGGGVTEALGEPYVARVRKGFDRAVFPSSLRRIDFLASTLNDDAGMLGAAMLV
ncbi:MAG: Glucokinase [Planctomycetota bacterium]|jgi:glucokinase